MTQNAATLECVVLRTEVEKLRAILMMVMGSEQMDKDGHDWRTCLSPSCAMARDALGVK